MAETPPVRGPMKATSTVSFAITGPAANIRNNPRIKLMDLFNFMMISSFV
jgi:hypothetical protein